VSDAPASYATQAQARAYVARVLGRSPARSPASVYVIAVPSLPRSPAWPGLAEALGKQLPGVRLLTFADVFPAEAAAESATVPAEARAAALAPAVQERVPRIAEQARGAVVIPRKVRHPETGALRYLLGYAARLEAEGLLSLGLPVLVLVPGGLVGWPDVRVHAAAAPASPRVPLEIDVPKAPAEGVILPTVAASYRALGLARPRPWRPPRAPRPNGTKPPPKPDQSARHCRAPSLCCAVSAKGSDHRVSPRSRPAL
jgi:hypothetical protein